MPKPSPINKSHGCVPSHRSAKYPAASPTATHANSISVGETCSWLGQSGRRYRFSVYDLDAPTLELDGVFVFAAPGNLFVPYQPLFIGHSALTSAL